VLKSGDFNQSIPSFMQQFIVVDMRNTTLFDETFNELLFAIYNKSRVEKPPIGKNPFAIKSDFNNKKQIEPPDYDWDDVNSEGDEQYGD
jgi:hypothetical protein